MPRHDCNAQASVSVHPLPLPPGSAMASQPTLIPQLTPKLDIAPIKSQWQKGKLIGRGTFGSVYVASNKYGNSEHFSNSFLFSIHLLDCSF